MSEAWETAPVETLTPKQRRQRQIADNTKQLIAEFGITEFSNFGRTSDWSALRALATEDASVRQIVSAVYWLDRDGGADIAAFSNAAATIPSRLLVKAKDRLADRLPLYPGLRWALRLEREALEKLDAMLEESPRTVVRRLLLERLKQMGVKLPNDHLHVCRWLYEAFQSRAAIVPHLAGRPHLTEYVERSNKTLAEYGVPV